MAYFSLTLPTPHYQSDARLGSSPLLHTQLGSKFFFSGSSCTVSRLKRLEQHALPQFAETLYHGLGANSQENLAKLHNGVLQWAIELGIPLPSGGATTWWAVIAPIVLSYMFATPGTAAGVVDFLYARMYSHAFRSFSPDEVELGRQLGEGSFGVVYEGFFPRVKGGASMERLHVVLKKVKSRVKGASEIHNSEIYMNHRLQRTASLACAEFLGTMQVKSLHAHGNLSEGMWLVWNFEGDRSLDHYLKQKNFPENVATVILGEDVKPSKREEVFIRNVTVIRTIFRQILNNLQDLHRTGVVHRDVKPLNLILAQDAGGFKFIDFGACVDLRSGYNYVPNETVIDPIYAAPERYVMPTSTPPLPPDPLCSLVSPLIWHLNTPDRFDLYSAGLILMQLCVKPLRHDAGLQSFNTELRRAGYDLNVWRSTCRYSKEEFAYLDADDRAGWELATALLQPRHDKDFFIWPSLGNSRPSASAALRHRFFKGSSAFPKSVSDQLLGPVFLGDLLTPSLPALSSHENLGSAVHSVLSTGYENLFGQARHRVKDKKVSTVTSSFGTQASPLSKAIEKVTTVASSSATHGSPLSKAVEKVATVASSQRSSPLSKAIAKVTNVTSPFTAHGSPSSKTVKNKRSAALHEVGGSSVGHRVEEEVKVRSVTSAVESIMQSSLLSSLAVTEKVNNAVHGVLNIGHDNFVGQTEDTLTSSRPSVANVELSPETLKTADSKKDAGTNLDWIRAVWPTVATGAFTVASGWMIMAGLSSSAHASYDIGKLLASSSGISGSAFLVFFLVIKPWLEEQEKNYRKSKVYKDEFANEELVTSESLQKVQMEQYKSVHSDQMKKGLVEAVQTLETQLSSLEALMLQKEEVSQQQHELVQKMEKLLLQPSWGDFSDGSEC